MNILELEETRRIRKGLGSLDYQFLQMEIPSFGDIPRIPISGMNESTYRSIGMLELRKAIRYSPYPSSFPHTQIGCMTLDLSLHQPPTDLALIKAKQNAVVELLKNPKLRGELESLVRGNSILGLLKEMRDPAKDNTGHHETLFYRLMKEPYISDEEREAGLTMGSFYHGTRKFVFQLMAPPEEYQPESQYLRSLIKGLSALKDDNSARIAANPVFVPRTQTYEQTYAESLRQACLSSHKLVAAIESLGRVDEILALSQYAENLVSPVSFPIIEDAPNHFLEVRDLRNPALSLQGMTEYIGSDVFLGDSRLTFLTGPVSGGKSALVRAILLTQRLAQIGSAIPSTYGRMSVADYIGYSAPLNNQLGAKEGRFGTEVIQAADKFYHSTPHSINVFDELFEATTKKEKDCAAIRLMRGLYGLGCSTIMISHNLGLIQKFREWDIGQFWQMGFEDGQPTYKIEPGISTESHSGRLAEKYGLTKEMNAHLKQFGRDLPS